MEVGVYPVRIGQQRDVLKFKSSTVIPSQQITPRRVHIKIISVGLILQSWAELSKQPWRKTIDKDLNKKKEILSSGVVRVSLHRTSLNNVLYSWNIYTRDPSVCRVLLNVRGSS